MNVNNDWKKKVGFPINYNSGPSSEDDFSGGDVVYRRQQSAGLLADGGDGAEADLLGTTPPRTVLRNKRQRKFRNVNTDSVQLRNIRRSIEDGAVTESLLDRGRKRLSHKMRALDRESKGQGRADSLPAPAQDAPALVESSNRFMCLSSRLKTPHGAPPPRPAPPDPPPPSRDPPSRESFYQTFSILINMGNIEKGCRRTISREEQVWQSSLKDMIWLELQAAVAGRSLAQQDAYLCAVRAAVPQLLHTIRDYRFENPNPCKGTSRLCARESRDDLPEDDGDVCCGADGSFGCLSFNCQQCIDAVGKALREVGSLLEAFYAAAALYPSSKAMQEEHPLIASGAFQNRLKAMCLWYNSALHMRLKILAIRRMLRSMRAKRRDGPLPETDSDLSRQSSESRPSQVRFNTPPVSSTPTDSNHSDSSALSDFKHEDSDHANHSKHDNDENRKGHADIDQEHFSQRQRNDSEKTKDQSYKKVEKTGEENDEVDNLEVKEKRNLRLQVEGEVDGADKKYDGTDRTTPEIIISDSKYGPTDTQSSTESGYSTSYEADGFNDVYRLGCLDELTGLKLLNKCTVSPLREHHREMLKTMGVRRMMMFINKLRAHLLGKVHLTLEKPDTVNAEEESVTDPSEVFDDTNDDDDRAEDEDKQRAYELRRYGCWSEECLAMGLPSYRSHFLLLSSIGMEAVHDYLTLRLEHTPSEPSCLTAKQLLHEMKEGLDIATEIRASFSCHVEAALKGLRAAAPARADLLRIVHTFDSTIETVFKQYLTYLRTVCAVEHMARCSLQAEWAFAARLAKRLACAAKLAPHTFAEIACIQLDRVHKRFEDRFRQIAETTAKMPDPDRHIVYALCREAQSLYASERDTTLQCAQWARALAARLKRAPGSAFMQQRANILDALMRVRDCIVTHARFIAERSAEARDEAALPRIRELLLQLYKLGFELHRELYKLAVVSTLPDQASQRRPISLQPARAKKEIGAKRPETVILNDFDPTIHKELHRFMNDGSRPSGYRPMTSPSNRTRVKLSRSESITEEAEASVFDERIFDAFGGQNQTSIELLLSGETKIHLDSNSHDLIELREEERATEEEKEWAMRVARAIVEFARCWMTFVVERCDEGRGLRPRWASQGLEFLMLACEPCNTKHLTDQEFEDLKQAMDGCISHVVGKPAPKTPDEGLSASDTRRRRPSPKSIPGGVGLGIDVSASDTDPLVDFKVLHGSDHSVRVLEAIQRLDSSRDEKLQEMKAVGQVLDAVVPSYEPKLRQVKFKWQRGLKIGAGTFGKVYTVVNTESGQLLAMKELSIGAGDRRALQRAANELRVLEGVIHPHLVRYYGCELHREEMLIFMELCVEGSLEALVATTGALEEPMIRRYTKQLVSAVIALHTRNIAHRDIKSGNIFLTNEGHCLKLGDFGCAVKIRANTTAAGELQGCVGTQAYMAPEVFMKSSGHGRAADIWSLGCVVTEMASGKRPFPEYDSNYQIMFVVGMGGRPSIPDSLSEEGQRFTRDCLTHEPDRRPKAQDLAQHHFLMMKSDEDCKCEPAYLIS